MSGKLLLVSDLEGCVITAGTGPQSRIMCNPKFFEAIQTHLNGAGNKVAFLGDYFDQGDLVAESIIQIMNLYNNNPGKVHIILGNRDVNKLRLAEEMKSVPQKVGAQKWGAWTNFYNGIEQQVSLKNRLPFIINGSMGAPGPMKLMPGISQERTGLLLLNVFSEENAKLYAKETGQLNSNTNQGKIVLTPAEQTFTDACRKLFQVGRIVAYDPEFKTLMSHAGGMEPFFFHDDSYYTDIESKLTAPEYYAKIEQARVLLQNEPSVKVDLKIPNTKSPEENLIENLKVYNDVYVSVANKVFSAVKKNNNTNNNGTKYMNRFALVQALGLKPDPKRHFVSFIQTCDNAGFCKGPISSLDEGVYTKEQYTTFQETLKEAGVNVVASGHVPHCAPVPLVYKREETANGPIYLCNDTSNGSRMVDVFDMTDEDSQIKSLPLGYVEKGGDVVGTGTLPDFGPGRFQETDKYKFKFMLGRFDSTKMPTFISDNKGNTVKYPGTNKKLIFPSRAPGASPFIYSEGVDDTQEGGRRRNKKTRKAKKANRKGRKTRKY